MKKLMIGILSALIVPTIASANITGFVTPSEMTITFNSVSIINTKNKKLKIMDGATSHTFRKADTDFAEASLAGISAPAGRYIGVQICYSTSRSIKLNNDRYDGTNGVIANGAGIYSIGSDASASSNTISTTAPGTGATTMGNYSVGNGSENCSDNYFLSPICVSTDQGKCKDGDMFVDAGSSKPNLNVLLDMYHAVGVDAANSAVDSHLAVYPYPTIGNPGAAIHLKYSSGGTVGDIQLLFGPDKKLIYAASWANNSIAGFSNGNGFVSATAAPGGAFLNSYGPTAVMKFDELTGNGTVQFATGNCGNSTTCTSGGMLTIANLLQAQGANAAVTCPADSAAVPPYLGYTYTSGTGVAGGPTSFVIQRIIDPKGMFTSKTGCTGTCGTY